MKIIALNLALIADAILWQSLHNPNAFSKKMENHVLAVALNFLYYNFVRIHSSIQMTPAMAAGVTDKLYDLDWILDMVDEAWPKPNRPKTYKKKGKDGGGLDDD